MAAAVLTSTFLSGEMLEEWEWARNNCLCNPCCIDQWWRKQVIHFAAAAAPWAVHGCKQQQCQAAALQGKQRKWPPLLCKRRHGLGAASRRESGSHSGTGLAACVHFLNNTTFPFLPLIAKKIILISQILISQSSQGIPVAAGSSCIWKTLTVLRYSELAT